MGSLLTHIIESRDSEPNWQPNDLDISCRTYRQVDQVSFILEKHFKTIWLPHYSGETYHSRYELFPGFHANVAYSPWENYSAEDCNHKFSWATLCASCTDGNTFLSHENTLEDIKHKILRLTSPGLIDKINFFKSIGQLGHYHLLKKNNHLRNYNKYIARGYTDLDGSVHRQLFGEILVIGTVTDVKP
jgi:hypothetical protein